MFETEPAIESLLHEGRQFPPPQAFAMNANTKDTEIYERAMENPETFWGQMAQEIDWFAPWKKILEWNPPFAQWFVGGKLNMAYNCLDRHLKGPRRNKAALMWEGESGESKVFTYLDLHREVCRAANALKSLGVKKGDRVTIYLPMIPELPISMLACARIGAPHSVIFGGFSAESIKDRINDCQAKVLITADAGYRKGSIVPLRNNADVALEGTPSIEKVVVVRRTGTADDQMKPGRDVWWHEIIENQSDTCEPEIMDSEDILFLLYTSGTTGKPKGVVHTTGG